MPRVVCQVHFAESQAVFRWSASGRFFPPYAVSGEGYRLLHDAADEARRSMVELQRAAGDAARGDAVVHAAEAGSRLFASLFPATGDDADTGQRVRQWLARLYDAGEVLYLEVASNDPSRIPWQVVFEGNTSDAALRTAAPGDPVWRGFWGARYALATSHRYNPRRGRDLLVEPQVVVSMDRACVERLAPETRRGIDEILSADEPNLSCVDTVEGLLNQIADEPPDVFVYFGPVTADGFKVGDDIVSLEAVQDRLRKARKGPVWNDVAIIVAPIAEEDDDAWATLRRSLVAQRFSAFVAPECGMAAETLARFLGKLLPHFLFEGDPLGCAVQDARSTTVPEGLAVTCYAVPSLQIAWNAEDVAPEDVAQGPPLPEDPFRPLAPLGESHRPLLAARDREVAAIAAEADRHQGEWVVLHGRAAVGKTSLLQAGVIPGFHDIHHANEVRESDADAPAAVPNVWRIRATNDLCGQLALFLCEHFGEARQYLAPDGQTETLDATESLARLFSGEEPESERVESGDASLDPVVVYSVLRNSPAVIQQVFEWMERSHPDEIVLVVDQCEELFSLTKSAEDVRSRNASTALLIELARGCSSTRLIAAIRTEYLGRWFSRFVEGGVGDRVHPLLLGGLGVPGLVEVLERPTLDEVAPHSSEIPAEKYGFAFAEGVAEEVAGACLHHANHHGPDAVALAQVVGHLLYSAALQKSQAVIESGDLQSLGGVEKAIVRYIEAVVAEAAAPSLARRWQQLLAPLYRRQPDGLLTANVVTGEEIGLAMPTEGGVSGWLTKTFSTRSADRHRRWLQAYDALAERDGGIVTRVALLSDQEKVEAYSLSSDVALVDIDEALQEHERRAQVNTKTIDLAFVFGAVLIVAAVALWVFIIQPQGRRIAAFDEERAQVEREASELIEKISAKEKALEQTITNLAWRAYVADIRQGYDAWRVGDTFRLHFSLVNAERKIRSPGFEWRFLKYQASPEIRTLVSHQAEVTDLVVLSDGRPVSLGNDGRVIVWEASSRQRAAVLKFAPGSAVSLAAAPKNGQLAVGLKSGMVQLVSLTKPPAAKEVAGHRGPVITLEYSHDGKHIASASADGEIRLRDANSGRNIATVETKREIEHLAANRDLSLVAAVTGGSTVSVWSLRQKKKVAEWTASDGKVHAARFLADGQRLLLAGGSIRDGVDGGFFGLWDALTGKTIGDVTSLEATALAIALSPDGKLLALGTKARTVELYDVETRRRVTRWRGHLGWVSTLAFSPDGNRVLSGSYDRTIKLWATVAPPERVQVGSAAVTHIAVSGDKRLLAAGGADGNIQVINLGSGRKVASLDARVEAVAALQWVTLEKRNQLAIIGKGKAGGLAVWDPATRQTTTKWNGDGKRVLSAAISGSRQLAALATEPSGVMLIEIESGKRVATLDQAKGRVRLLSFSPDGKWLLGAEENGRVHLWRTSPVQYQPLVSAHVSEQSERVTAAAFFHGRPWLVLADPQRGITLWDLTDGSLRGSVRAHAGEVFAIDVAANDATFATAGRDGTLKLWALVNDVLQHGDVLTFSEHDGAVRSVAFTHDLSLLASGGSDGVVQLRWAGRIEAENPRKKGG